MAKLVLKVNGLEFSGWKRARVTYGVDAIAGGFELSVTDRWDGNALPWAIHEEDECKLSVNGETLIDGWVDERSVGYSADDRTLGVTGRDRSGALVDCSAVVGAFQFKDLSILGIAKKLCDPFGISVTLDPSVTARTIRLTTKKHDRGSVTGAGSSGKRTGLKIPKAPKKFTINPGESAFAVLDRACRLAAVVPVSDRKGGILLTRTGSARAAVDLVEGGNILSASAQYNGTGRYRRYTVRGQSAGTDEWFGTSAAAASGEAIDANVRRLDRVLLIRPESAVTPESAKSRAAWEAVTRAARSAQVSVTVAGWTQGPNLPLWPVNALVNVASDMIGIRGPMLITQVVLTVDDQSGEYAELTLKRPDAFIPEPTVTAASEHYWKEIAHGVK